MNDYTPAQHQFLASVINVEIDEQTEGIVNPPAPQGKPVVDWTEYVASDSIKGRRYMVRHFTDGVTDCDCQGYRGHGHCKHQGRGKLAHGIKLFAPTAAQDGVDRNTAAEPVTVAERVTPKISYADAMRDLGFEPAA